MRVMALVIMLLGTSCASQPGRDGPATPATSDTVSYPGDATDPMDLPPPRGGGTDSTRSPR